MEFDMLKKVVYTQKLTPQLPMVIIDLIGFTILQHCIGTLNTIEFLINILCMNYDRLIR